MTKVTLLCIGCNHIFDYGHESRNAEIADFVFAPCPKCKSKGGHKCLGLATTQVIQDIEVAIQQLRTAPDASEYKPDMVALASHLMEIALDMDGEKQ